MEDKENLEQQMQTAEIESQEEVKIVEQQDNEVPVETTIEETAETVDDGAEQNVDNGVSKKRIKKQKIKKDKKAEVVNRYEGLSDDELYAKIETDRLLQRKKRRKIATLIGMCFAFVLAVCVIVLAVVPVSLKPRCMSDDFYSVIIYPGRTSGGVSFTDEDDRFGQFKKMYDEAFSQTYISAIFNGSLVATQPEERKEKASDVIGSTGKLNQGNIYYVALKYGENKTFTLQNGQPYISNRATSTWKGKLTFSSVYFELSAKEGLQATNIYFIINNYTKSDGTLDDVEYIVKVSVRADTSAIYSAFENHKFDNQI